MGGFKSGYVFEPITTGHVERGRAWVGRLCYSGVKISSVRVIAKVNTTMIEFIKDWSLSRI